MSDLSTLPLLDQTTERGGVVVRRPDELVGERRFTFRSRWTTTVHNNNHTTHHISVNPELDADEVSFAPFGGGTRTYRIAGGPESIPADADEPSPDVTVPIEVEPRGGA